MTSAVIIDPTDADYEDCRIATVTREGDQWVIRRDDGWIFGVADDRNAASVVPKEGDAARFYGRGIGLPVRGLAINGHTIFYETEAGMSLRPRPALPKK